MTQKRSVAPLVVSIISSVAALIAIIASLLFMMALNNDAGTSGDYITNEVILFLFEFIIYIYLAAGAALVGFITGIVGMVLSIIKKRVSIIWLPILAMLGCIGAIVIVCISFPLA